MRRRKAKPLAPSVTNMKAFFRKLFCAESFSILCRALFNVASTLFVSCVFLGMTSGAGALLSLPIVFFLARIPAPLEIIQTLPKAFATLASVIGMFMILESKHKEYERNDKSIIIEVAVVAWLAGICALWFIF